MSQLTIVHRCSSKWHQDMFLCRTLCVWNEQPFTAPVDLDLGLTVEEVMPDIWLIETSKLIIMYNLWRRHTVVLCNCIVTSKVSQAQHLIVSRILLTWMKSLRIKVLFTNWCTMELS